MQEQNKEGYSLQTEPGKLISSGMGMYFFLSIADIKVPLYCMNAPLLKGFSATSEMIFLRVEEPPHLAF